MIFSRSGRRKVCCRLRAIIRALSAAILWGLLLCSSAVCAEEPAGDPESDELKSENHKAVVAEMKQRLADITLVRRKQEPRVAALVPEPILNWDDLPRGHHHGTLWVWGAKGRPAAILEMYTLNFSKTIIGRPGTVVHSLSPEPLYAEGGRPWDWAPEKPGFTPQKLDDAPAPAATKNLRRLQMRALAKRCSSKEDLFGDRAELRLLTTPVWHYEAPDEGILDGGLFVFVHGGTNPEVVLILEAIRGTEGEDFWQIGCVRLTHAEAQVTFDDRQVWSVPTYGESNPKSPYYWLP